MFTEDNLKSFVHKFIILARKNGYEDDFIMKTLSQIINEIYRDNPDNVPEDIANEIKKALDARQEKKPAINVHASKPQDVAIEVSKIGKELRNREHIQDYYEHDEEGKLIGCPVQTGSIFPKGKKAPKGKKRAIPQPIYSILMLDYDAEKLKQKCFDIPSIGKLAPFDLEVLTHCVTLYKAGNEYVSADMIYRLMNGGADKQLHTVMRERIYQALRRLDCTRIYILAEQEVEAGYNSKLRYEGSLLPNEIMYSECITLNGKEVQDCIHLFRNSPLYDYSEDKRQVSSLPVGMLTIPEINGTEQNILLIHYLARFIVEASNDNTPLNSTRSYRLIYEYLGVDSDNPQVLRNAQARIRATTRAILTEWARRGFIKGFQELTENNTPPKPREKVAKIKVELLSSKELQALRKQ